MSATVSPSVLVVVAPDRIAYRDALFSIGRALEGYVKPPSPLAPWEAAEWDVPDPRGVAAGLADALAGIAVDWALLPVANRRKRLLVSDMDSTIIGCECIDELADFAGKRMEIAAVTERAMRGEIEFEEALLERVRQLRGLSTEALDRCFRERVRLNPGAATLVRTMAANGARCVLVSGGFTYFTRRVAELAGFQADVGNVLLEEAGALSGDVGRPILGREAKLSTLKAEAAAMGIGPVDAIAIGDGANDLDMIGAAGLGLAYRAKPVVAEQASARIEHTSLETALFFQGYRRAEFVATVN